MSSEEKKLLNVNINGKWKKFPAGTRIIEAIRGEDDYGKIEEEVPHYCYHPKLSSPGNCRMCLIEMGMPARLAPGEEPKKDKDGFLEIGWMPRPAIACANTIAENMGIRTNSELTKNCREGVMEFLLANHPLDCPICDQAGECQLQEFAIDYGRGKSRFREQKVKKPKNSVIGPRITLDDERCVMCSRCIRFAEEIVDEPVIGFVNRGSYTTLAVHPDKQFVSNYSLNTVDICPVGALTSTDFRFRSRVWFLKTKKTICGGCARGCNIEVSLRGNDILRVEPRLNNEVNSAWMCDYGRFFHQYAETEKRLDSPLRLSQLGEHERCSWEDLFDDVKEQIEKADEENIVIVVSASLTNEELYLVRLLALKLGVLKVEAPAKFGENDDYLQTSDKNSNSAGCKLLLTDPTEKSNERIKKYFKDGDVSLLISIEENLLSLGLSSDDLENVAYKVMISTVANPSLKYADVVFPSTSIMEKSGTMINATGRLQKLNSVQNPPSNVFEQWEILSKIYEITGGKKYNSVEEIFYEFENELPIFADIEWDDIGDLGKQLLENSNKIPLLEREKEKIKEGLIVG